MKKHHLISIITRYTTFSNYLLSDLFRCCGFLIMLIFPTLVFSQTNVTKLSINPQTYKATGHVRDTIYDSYEYFKAAAPVSGQVYYTCKNSNVIFQTGSGIAANGSLNIKYLFEQGDTIYIRTLNRSFSALDFTVHIGGISLDNALPQQYLNNQIENLWFAYPTYHGGSIYLFGEQQAIDNYVEYATSSDKTIRPFKHFAQINLAEYDTIYIKQTQRIGYGFNKYQSDKNSPIHPYQAQLGNNSVPADYCINSNFYGQYIADADTLIRIEKFIDNRNVYVYINGVYIDLFYDNDLIRVHENDTVLFYFQVYDELTTLGFDVEYATEEIGCSYQNPINLADNADSVVLDFSQTERLFVSCKGLIIYTQNQTIKPEGEADEFYNDANYQSWMYRDSRSIRRFVAPIGTKATLHFVYRPTKVESVAVSDTNYFESGDMFSIVRYNNCAKSGKHFFISDGDNTNYIVDNYSVRSVLSYEGEGSDFHLPYGFCWVNINGKPFTWTVSYTDRSPGEYQVFSDTIRGPGCYKFTLYTDSLANADYNSRYSIVYEVQQRSTQVFELNGDFKIFDHTINKIYEPGYYYKYIGYDTYKDSVIYCKITEYPVPKIITDTVTKDLNTDTLFVGNNSAIKLDSLKNYVLIYEPAQPGTFIFWLRDSNGEPFRGNTNYGSIADKQPIEIRDLDTKTLKIYNTFYQNVTLYSEFHPLEKGYFSEYPKEAFVGENTGSVIKNYFSRKYFNFLAPEDGAYCLYSDDKQTTFRAHRQEFKKGDRYSFDIILDDTASDYAFSIVKENITDTIYKDLILRGFTIEESREFRTQYRIGYRYKANDNGQLSLSGVTYGGHIYNERMELIYTFGGNLSSFDVAKDSVYIIIPNSIFTATSITAIFKQGNYGLKDNPLSAHLGFNNMLTENGEALGGLALYYTYKAEKNGYLHLISSYVTLDNAEQYNFVNGPVSSFKCKKDSVYSFRTYAFKEYMFLGYSETGTFEAPDSLIVAEGTYQVAIGNNMFIGFYVAPADGYLNVDVPSMNEENFIMMGGDYKEPNFYRKGEIIPIELESYAVGTTIPLTIDFIEVAEGSQIRTALNPHQSECDVMDEVEFTSLSRLANINEWDFNEDGIADAYGQHPTYKFTEPGEYSIRLVTGNCFDLDTIYSIITVNLTCEYYRFDLGPDLTVKYSESAALYAVDGTIWSTGYIGEELSLQNYTEKDTTQTIWASFENDSCIFYDTIKVTYLSEVSSIVEENTCHISVYPTVVTDHLVIDAKKEQLQSVSVISNQGVSLLNKRCNNQFETVYLSHLSDGCYIVVVHTSDKVAYFKILKR
ncbi:MAG: T9SS type A sorting domain-containing protein [Marinilabiliaceae bacterium]|nr:T9SS type A sorting domain-containing protein [Marinilabiliaceae bacterium]